MAAIKKRSEIKSSDKNSLVAQKFKYYEGVGFKLTTFLDDVKGESSKGRPLPDSLKAPGVTDAGAKAYGDAYGKAKEEIKRVTDSLTPQEIDFLSGLGFTNPSDEAKKRTDVLNSALTAWDKAASAYMKQAGAQGDAARADMKKRFAEFDDAIFTKGKTPVKPDA